MRKARRYSRARSRSMRSGFTDGSRTVVCPSVTVSPALEKSRLGDALADGRHSFGRLAAPGNSGSCCISSTKTSRVLPTLISSRGSRTRSSVTVMLLSRVPFKLPKSRTNRFPLLRKTSACSRLHNSSLRTTRLVAAPPTCSAPVSQREHVPKAVVAAHDQICGSSLRHCQARIEPSLRIVSIVAVRSRVAIRRQFAGRTGSSEFSSCSGNSFLRLPLCVRIGFLSSRHPPTISETRSRCARESTLRI